MIINSKEKMIIEKYLKSTYCIKSISDTRFDFEFDDLDTTIDALTDIFINYGLKENDEPNQDGLILDDLIGKLWKLKG